MPNRPNHAQLLQHAYTANPDSPRHAFKAVRIVSADGTLATTDIYREDGERLSRCFGARLALSRGLLHLEVDYEAVTPDGASRAVVFEREPVELDYGGVVAQTHILMPTRIEIEAVCLDGRPTYITEPQQFRRLPPVAPQELLSQLRALEAERDRLRKQLGMAED